MKLEAKLKRWFYKTKSRLHVWSYILAEKLFKLLAKLDLVVEHKKRYMNFLDNNSPVPAPDIKSDRYVFSVSYINRKVENVNQYWFESKRGKKLFTMWDEKFVESHISYRAELQSFFAHFSPRQKMWVHRHSPRIVIQMGNDYCPVPRTSDPVEKLYFKTHHCNFEDCRYAFEFRYPQSHISETPPEVISESYRAFSNGMMSKVTEINKILTGADYDGELVSPDKTPLSENLLCRKCGLPVFASAKENYRFMCLKHGELEFHDVDRVDPIHYKYVLDNTMDILEDLIHNFSTTECPQDSNL